MKHLPELLNSVWSSSRRYCFFSYYFNAGFNFHTTNFPTHLFRNFFFSKEMEQKKKMWQWLEFIVCRSPASVCRSNIWVCVEKKNNKMRRMDLNMAWFKQNLLQNRASKNSKCYFDCLIKGERTELWFPNETCISICIISTQFFLREKSFCDRRKMKHFKSTSSALSERWSPSVEGHVRRGMSSFKIIADLQLTSLPLSHLPLGTRRLSLGY